MTAPGVDATPPPYFHDDTGSVRFWVRSDAGASVGATVTKETLHYRFGAEFGGRDALAVYAANHVQIDAAVRRRIAGGSIEPVMLREHDFAVRAPTGPGPTIASGR